MIASTGAAGAVGCALVGTLKANYHVISLDRAESSEADESVVGDLGHNESVATALQGIRARHHTHLASVVHLAACFDCTGE
jgi:nucleoside-diphosphate-sugar epimerase